MSGNFTESEIQTIRDNKKRMGDAWVGSPEFEKIVNISLERTAATTAAWTTRPVTTLSTLPFVGKTYRSRGRRSANKVSAWAVKPPEFPSEAAALGASHAFEFADMMHHAENARICGTGHLLEAVILGMADTLAKATDKDREQHIACIRGFAAVLEASASAWLSGFGNSDSSNATQHHTRLGHLANLQHTLRMNNRWVYRARNEAFRQELITGVTA